VNANSGARIALGLALGPMIALGLARFAYAIVLPEMRAVLGLTFTQTGALGAANAAGYLAGTLLTPMLARALGQKRAFDLGALLTALFVLLTGASASYAWLLALRFLSGASGAVVFVTGSTLVARLATQYERPPALLVATYFSGVGIGLIGSGLIAPLLLQTNRFDWLTARWQLCWVLLGALGLLAYGLGRTRWAPSDEVVTAAESTGGFDWRPIALMLLAYGLFGLGYISYMTFIIAFIQTGLGSVAGVMAAWIALGLMIVLSPRLWRRVLDEAPRGLAFARVCLVLAVAVLLPLLRVDIATVLVSASLFGSFLMVPSAVTIYVRRTVPRAHWVSGVTLATVMFSIGQVIGPVVSGALADWSGSLSAGLVFSAVTLLAGAGVALRVRDGVAV
jgi:predicted MFS family arabinose efflux permease